MQLTRRVLIFALLGIMFILSLAVPLAAQQLPSPETGAAATGNVPQAVPAAANDYAVFLRKDKRVTSVSVKMDGVGNLHAAYVISVPWGEKPPAVYAFCAANADCNNPDAWQSVSMGQYAIEVQLQLTPLNQPRLMVNTISGVGNTNWFYYGECNTGCTSFDNWKYGYAFNKAETAVVDIADMDQPQRNFALDPQGRPRFMFYDRNYHVDPDHWGGFYKWCDTDCTERENWQEAWLLIGAIWEYPSLTFTKNGKPRMVSQIYSSGNTQGVFYVECNNECDDLNDFSIVQIAVRGSETLPSWDIELDAQDRPRIVMYRGSDIDRPKGERLLYLECNADCHKSSSWITTDLGLRQGDGQDPDLEIDAQGRPRIAWTGGNAYIGFSYCNTTCGESTAWENLYFQDEGTSKWLEELPQALPPHCTDSIWKPKNTVLSVDSADTLHIGFDIEVNARCVEQSPGTPTPYIRYRRIWDTVRLISFPLNGGGSPEEPTATATSTNTARSEATATNTAPATNTPTGTTRATNTPTGTTAPATPTHTPTTDPNTGPRDLFSVFLPAVQRESPLNP